MILQNYVTIEKIVPNLYWAEDTGPTVDPTVITEPAGEESMPAPGIAITLAGIAVALFASRKRQD